MVSALAAWWGAELRLPLLLFAHRHAKDQLLDWRTFLTSAGDIILMGAWCFPFIFSPKLTCFIFSQGQIFMGTKDRKTSSGQNQRVKLVAVENESACEPVWAKGGAGRFSRSWKEIALGKSLQAVGSYLVSAFCMFYNEGFLDSARWVFPCSLAGAGSSSCFISAGLYFGAKQCWGAQVWIQRA